MLKLRRSTKTLLQSLLDESSESSSDDEDEEELGDGSSSSSATVLPISLAVSVSTGIVGIAAEIDANPSVSSVDAKTGPSSISRAPSNTILELVTRGLRTGAGLGGACAFFTRSISIISDADVSYSFSM